MKILFVTTVSMTMGFFPEHIRMLQDAGHTVELATNLNEPLKASVVALGCKTHNIPFSRSPLSRDNIAAYKALKSVIENGDFDIVHTHTPIASALVRIASSKLRKRGLKVFYTAHGFHFYRGAPLKNWLIYYPVEKICSRMTDVQITITKEDFDRAKRRLHAKNTVYVPGVGIDSESFRTSDGYTPGMLRRELGIPDKAMLVLSVGELNENKNHSAVIKAIASIERRDIYYVICGEGDRRDSLTELANILDISDRVFLLGVRSDVPDWMAEADIFVLPSLREGLSVATMEAMASSLPVICGDIRGNRDLIIDNNGGILVDPAKPEQFAAAITSLINSSVLRGKMGRYNKNAVKNFSLNRVLKELKDIYGV